MLLWSGIRTIHETFLKGFKGLMKEQPTVVKNVLVRELMIQIYAHLLGNHKNEQWTRL